MSMLRKLLFPLSLLFYIVQVFRNFLYDKNIIANSKFNIPIISVGNLSVGGTGKTPMVEYLLAKYIEKYKIAILSRGYKRKSKGFVKLNEKSEISYVGDEPFILKKCFPKSKVYVSENRVSGIKSILEDFDCDLIILDDAFQHRRLSVNLNIILTNYSCPFYNDYIMPVGNLREPFSSYKRADIIIVSKCPENLSSDEMDEIKLKIKPKKNQKLFFTKIKYKDKIFGDRILKISNLIGKEIVLITGIAETKSIEKYFNEKKIKFKHLKYSDHHKYSNNDLNVIKKISKNKNVLTTKKDYYKLKENINNLFYLDIETNFLKDELIFQEEINKLIN